MVSYFQRGVNQIMNKNEHMTLGLDLGIASVGWCLFKSDENENPERIIDLGSFVYDQLEDKKRGERENEKRRVKRGMRRQRRRKVRRLSDCRDLFKKYLNVDFEIKNNTLLVKGKPANDIYKSATNEECKTPFGLKLKGLNEKLTPEEFALALYHYMKYRGFKSNRKSAEKNDEKQKVLLSAISNMTEQRKKLGDDSYITQLIWKNFEEKKKNSPSISIHNKPKEYNLTIERAEYEREIIALFDKQISFGVASEEFKQEYLKAYLRQRSYSNGPADPSPYKVDFAKARGTCPFDNNPYAIKDSYSATAFLLLSKLTNFRYKTIIDNSFRSLTKEQVNEAFAQIISKIEKNKNGNIKDEGIKYSDLLQVCKISDTNQLIIKDLTLTNKEKRELKESLGKKELEAEDWERYIKKEQEKLFDKTFFKKSKFFNKLYDCFSRNKIDVCNDAHAQRKFNYVAFVSFKYKTDDQIRKALLKPNAEDPNMTDLSFTEDEINSILDIPENASMTINLSQELCDRLIPVMKKEGLQYDKAMDRIEIKHYDPLGKKEKGLEPLPEIENALKGIGITLNNPVVKHTLVQMRKIINAIIKTYGFPTSYSVELARELKKNFKEREQLRFDQLDNQNENIRIKLEMMDKFHNQIHSFYDAGKKDNFLRYKLFKEQKGISPYTGEEINEDLIFKNNYYQIDHILPISRSFNDSISNKVLVETRENQNKKNKTPWEYYDEHQFSIIENFAKSCPDRKKAANLLFKGKIEDSSDFINADSTDTSYIAKLATKLINHYLLKKDQKCKTISGAVTAKLRNLWNVSGRVHSYISTYENKMYKMRDINNYIYDSIELDGKTITFKFNYIIERTRLERLKPSGESIKIEVKKKNPKKMTSDDIAFNSHFETVLNNFEYYFSKFSKCRGNDITSLQEITNHLTADSETSDTYDEAMSYVLADVYKQITQLCNKKNRDNDLHHALDAAVIGCVTPSAIKRITDFYQDEECEIDYRTGEEKLSIQLPYPDFNKEVLLRVYERDENKLVEELNKLPMYKNDPATHETVHVLWPTRQQKTNYKGSVSEDTLLSLKEIDGEKWLTRTISVNELDREKIDKIINPNNGNDAVIAACKEWLNIEKKERPPYPILSKKGVSIKKVTLKDTKLKLDPITKEPITSLPLLGENRYANNSDNIRVDVYRSNDASNETLYFVPIYYYQLFNEKRKSNHQVMYSVYTKQGDNGCTVLCSHELKKWYHKILSLNRNSLIELTLNNGGNGLAYSGGISSGLLEIYSILGDNFDLYNTGLTSNVGKKQIQITVSTIKSIKLHNISILGKIS